MARPTKLPHARLVRTIDDISSKSKYMRTDKWNKFIEGLMWQVVTRLRKKPLPQFPKIRGWKKHESNWKYALLEIRRQELKLIKKTLRSCGL